MTAQAGSMRRHGCDEAVDAVVVGAGAGAGPLVAQLAARGLRVVVLEAGRDRLSMGFTPDEVESADLYWLGERLSGGDTPEAFGANNSGIGVGGSTLHWGAFCPRPAPADFQLRSRSGQGEDWPLTVAELTPYLERVEHIIGVSGPAEYPWDPSRRYLLPPVPRNPSAHAMARGCERLGLRSTDAPAAVLSRDRVGVDGGPPRLACAGCGACHQGCRNDAKATTANSFLRQAVADGATIRTGCMVVDIERDGRGLVSAVSYLEDGAMRRQRCAALFLCAGAVETPRLLLHTGLANASGQVGRNYMAHVATQVWGSVDEDTHPHRGYPSSLISEDMLQAPDADHAGGYLMQSLGMMPATWGNLVARGPALWGEVLTDRLMGYTRSVGMGINGDCLPSEHNRLTLSDEVDGSLMAKPRIAFSYGDNERRMDAHAVRTMTAILEAAGVRDIWSAPRSAHTIGTCRMGTDGDRSVVDPHGRSHDIANLWICDNSVFPSALAANPALTIMALSLRTADAFLRG